MDNEPYRDLSHLQLIATVSDWLRSQGNLVTNEHRLPDDRVADIIYLTPGGAVHIVECKLSLTSTLVKSAVDKYYQWCNALWVASNDAERWFNFPYERSISLGNLRWPVGMLQVSLGQVAVVADPCARTLDPVLFARVKHSLPKG